MRDGFDVAIRSFRTQGPGVEAVPLASSPWMVVGSPALLGGGPVDPTSLPWVWIDETENGDDFARRLGIDPGKLKKVVVGNAVLEISAAVLGLGLALSTEVAARSELQSGRLRQVPLPGLPVAEYFAIVPTAPRRPAIDLFVNWVRGLF